MRREESEWFQNGWTKEWWLSLPVADRHRVLGAMTPAEIEEYFRDWRIWAHDYQLPPETDWDTWLFLAGRGSGKTRSAVEYIIDAVKDGWAQRIAIVGQGEDDVRNVMVEGESGFLQCSPSGFKPTFSPSAGGGRVIWPNGCTAYIYSIADTEALRGPQFHLGWCDEPMAAPRVLRERALDNLEFCLRLGVHPRLILTTTPKKDPWLRQMEKDAKDPEKKIHIARATTHDNALNLAANFLRKIDRKYGGTRIGKQEIDGKILGDDDGALWTEDGLEKCRKGYEGLDPYDVADTCEKIVVGVDPNTKDENGKAKKTAHAAGIVVCGRRGRERFVLADKSIAGGPSKWGRAIVEAAIEFEADEILAEDNQGGDMVKLVVLQAIDDYFREFGIRCKAKVHLAHAKKDKKGRAEPVATMYERDRVHHVGDKEKFADLEMQMLYIHEEQDPTGEDFDRMDGMVWALTRLGLRKSSLGTSSSGGAGIMTFSQFGASNGQAN